MAETGQEQGREQAAEATITSTKVIATARMDLVSNAPFAATAYRLNVVETDRRHVPNRFAMAMIAAVCVRVIFVRVRVEIVGNGLERDHRRVVPRSRNVSVRILHVMRVVSPKGIPDRAAARANGVQQSGATTQSVIVRVHLINSAA
tara:strand:- start:328 stop:768 length:441 start_codon:yes stop_codon:yes gene_type:complete